MKDAVLLFYGAAMGVRQSLVRRGFLQTALVGLERIRNLNSRDVLSRLNPPPEIKNLAHPFDTEYGVDTGGLLTGRDLHTGHAHDAHNVGYYGIAPSVFRTTLRNWRETLPAGADISSYTFVDVGAGKGRALLLASELPFREVIGIELSKDLAHVAERNIDRWQLAGRAQCKIRVAQQDATDFSWPQTPLVLFLYNPFGRKVLERLLARLQSAIAAGSGPTDILYANPDCDFVMDRYPSFVRTWSEQIETSETDRAAILSHSNASMFARTVV